jgi:phosphoglycerate dehydrogenase-like enzyme
MSRGPLVDEAALADALRKQVIAGAVTDVLPPSAADPLVKLPEDKILFSPHIAGMCSESGHRIMMLSAENIGRALAGQDPLCVVDP